MEGPMSTMQNQPRTQPGSVDDAAQGPGADPSGFADLVGTQARGGAAGNRWLWVAVAGVAAVGLASAGGFLMVRSMIHPKPAPDAAVVLPATIQGMLALPAANDPMQAQAWQAKAKAALGTAPFAVRTYAPDRSQRTVRVVAARTDLAKQLDQNWAVDAGHQVGEDRCTQNVRPVAAGKAGIRPTVMLCWRDSAELSAYVLIIDPKATVTEAEGSTALDQVWDAVD
jgi:hypothetical protein